MCLECDDRMLGNWRVFVFLVLEHLLGIKSNVEVHYNQHKHMYIMQCNTRPINILQPKFRQSSITSLQCLETNLVKRLENHVE